MATIKINDTAFEFIEKGSGTTVIFIHGSINDYRIWKYQVEPFSKHFRTIAYSRRYHYPNEWTGDGSDYSIALHVKDLIGLIEALDPGRVHLVGSSYGAYTALMAAMERPELIRSLVLGEPPILPLLVTDPKKPLQLLSLFLKDFSTGLKFMKFGMNHMKPSQEALKNDRLEEGVKLFVTGVLGEEGYEKLPGDVRSTFMDNARSLKVEMLGPGFPPFPVNLAKKMTTPALLVYGQNSPGFLRAISDRLSAILPDTEKTVIAEASHLIHFENPVAYNEKVLEFLAAHDG